MLAWGTMKAIVFQTEPSQKGRKRMGTKARRQKSPRVLCWMDKKFQRETGREIIFLCDK